MITKKFGFVKDENNLQLKEVLKNNAKLREVYIETYPENPLGHSSSFMLLSPVGIMTFPPRHSLEMTNLCWLPVATSLTVLLNMAGLVTW